MNICCCGVSCTRALGTPGAEASIELILQPQLITIAREVKNVSGFSPHLHHAVLLIPKTAQRLFAVQPECFVTIF
jgi:hypothetical protein